MTPAGRFRAGPPAPPRPPAPHRAWDADVRWEQEAGSGRFRAVAIAADGEEAESRALRAHPVAAEHRRRAGPC